MISGGSENVESDVSESTRVVNVKDQFYRDAELRFKVETGNGR